jgi:hypothetical protein
MLTIALATLVATALSIPAGAQEPAPTAIPEVVNIEDPAGDGNYLNDQGSGEVGDNVTPADASTVADILKVWFTHDADVIRAHILTEAPHSANTASAYFYRVQVDPGGDPNCLRLQVSTGGPTNPTATEPTGSLRDLCGDADETYTEGITATIEETADGQGIATVTIPRSTHPAFADNLVLAAPTAHSRNSIGGAVTAPQVDTTAAGTDYTITPPPVEEPPIKKGCKKGSPKAKKKGCKKR